MQSKFLSVSTELIGLRILRLVDSVNPILGAQQEMTQFKVCAIAPSNLIFAGILFAFLFPAVADEVKGLLVVSDVSVAPAIAPSYEYTSFKNYGTTFQAVLPNGKIVSGTVQSVVVNLEFADPPAQLLEKMESVSAANTNAAKLLQSRIRDLKAALASGIGAAPATGAPAEAPLAALATSISLGGQEFKQVKPLRIVGQSLNFMHAGGARSIPLTELSLKTLKQLGGMNEALLNSPEFEQAIAFYVPTLVIGSEVHFGVKVLAESGGELTLLTDAGRVACKLSDVPVGRREELLKTMPAPEVQPVVPPREVKPEPSMALDDRVSEPLPRLPGPFLSMDGRGTDPLLESQTNPEMPLPPQMPPPPQLISHQPAVVVFPPEEVAPVEESFEALSAAAHAGDARSMANLGFYYLTAENDPEMEGKALHWFQKGAEAGDVMAIVGLGRCYENGFGTAKNPELAFNTYKLAAEKGYGAAYFELGLCYGEGIGTWEDSGLAVYSYEEGAKLGSSDCMTALGICYQYGAEGVIASGSKAVEYYEKAIQTGGWTVPSAQMNLAKIFMEGHDVQKDMRVAVEYFKQAANGGNDEAMNQLGHIYRNAGDFDRAYQWYKKGATAGNIESTDCLGYCYLMGDGVARNPETAIVCFQKASQAGDSGADYHLGYCYVEGLGVAKDLEKARSYFEKSAEAGCQPAQKELDILDGKAVRLTAQQEFIQMMMDASLYDPADEDARRQAHAAQMNDINNGRIAAGREPIH